MRSLLLLVMSFVLSAPGSPAFAQDWPQKPIKMVVPFGPGSASDVLPRIVFEPLQAQLGQSIVIENRAGAGGTIGAALAARSQPDGYTLLVHSSGLALAPALYPNLGFKPDTDLVAIAMIGSVPNVLIVPPSKGIKTIGEFVAYARANPGKLSFASSGVGSALHLSAERFRIAAGFEAVHVPFKSGSEAMTEVITGRVDYFFAPLATVLPFIREGQVVPLAVSSRSRAEQLPDVPTTIEAGFANSDYTPWFGIFGPAGIPAPIVHKLNREIIKAMQSPAAREKLQKSGVQLTPISSEEFSALLRDEIGTMGEFLRKTGLNAN